MSQISPILPIVLSSQGKTLELNRPLVMGILNLTPDSFYDGGKYSISEVVAVNRVKEMIQQGAEIIDIGGTSSKPGAPLIDPLVEQERLIPFFNAIREAFPDVWISIDTYHSSTAALCLQNGADIVNDISAGTIDENIFKVTADFNCPYILLHMQGVPGTMQDAPSYVDVVKHISQFFSEKVRLLNSYGVKQIILDPGFGFGKTVEHNYAILKDLNLFQTNLQLPVLAGISRKSMVNKVIGTKPEDALNGTTALHMIALMNGASILRVHDVKEARQTILLFEKYKSANN
jgi:dihydropteroate synthase